MMTIQLEFLHKHLVVYLNQIDTKQAPLFGKMNALQMIEHLIYSVRIASGKLEVPEVLIGEISERAKNFMLTDKPFKENTPNQLLPDTPPPFSYSSKEEALEILQQEINDFINVYTTQPTLKIRNAFFGNLNFQEQVHLLHKHFIHHLKQFGIQI